MLRATLDFILHDWLDVAALTARPRFADHTRATFDSVLDTCERIADEVFAPVNREVDLQEPRLEGDKVVLPAGAYATANAYVASGLLAATQDYGVDGLQLPYVVATAANALFCKAGIGLGGASMLTVGNANLLMAHGTQAQKRVFAQAELSGRWFGTMCLSEPQAGSSLADIVTRAIPDAEGAESDPLGPRYRLHGAKMWISNGDHELTENIVHLVLAKVPNTDGRVVPGAKDISLFIVPKRLVDTDGRLTGERNDVAVIGLNHKLGYRGIPNALLNFGDGRYCVQGRPGAIGYRVGAEGEGLRCMFHMMNESRIGVGLGAAAIAYAGYEASLAYACERRQGRALAADGKLSSTGPVRIIEHPDVRRMLLAQKAYAEGGLALSLYCARLVDEARTAEPDAAQEARALLDLLTPIAKSWPSEWGVEANSLAIQVLGGAGYTRDFPVEQYWRDNRLNMIHEGTHGIQGLDLLGRKVRLDGGAALQLLRSRIESTIAASGSVEELRACSVQLAAALDSVQRGVDAAWATGNHVEALANATLFLQALGHLVVAWLWLDLSVAAHRRAAGASDELAARRARGMMQSTRYFFDYELPKLAAWLGPVASRNSVCRDMLEEWFAS